MPGNKLFENWIVRFRSSRLFNRILSGAELSGLMLDESSRKFFYPESMEIVNKTVFAVAKVGEDEEALFIACGGENRKRVMGHFSGLEYRENGIIIKMCELSEENAFSLQKYLIHTRPSILPIDGVTVGVGDRLGIATQGHIRSFANRNAIPVFAQQSVRELMFTNRSFSRVMSDVIWAVFRSGYKMPWGADGDHLKDENWMKKAIEAGFRMITADVSDFIRDEYYLKSDSSILSKYDTLDNRYRKDIEGIFLNREFFLGEGASGHEKINKINFDRIQLARCALIYGKAVEKAILMYRRVIDMAGGNDINFELSVDEVSIPTTVYDHIFISELLDINGVRLFSMAPRFSGSFQKGIDYEGKLAEFERDLRIQNSIAVDRGYKISIHSGSDKFKIFPIIGKVCGGRFHLKTSGTSWLESLRVLAKEEPLFFRKLYRVSFDRFEFAKKYYHVKADKGNAPHPDSLRDDELERLLNNSVTRQILHITYGEILKNDGLKEEFFSLMRKHRELYWEYLEKHIGSHLDALGVG